MHGISEYELFVKNDRSIALTPKPSPAAAGEGRRRSGGVGAGFEQKLRAESPSYQ
jgi:hypothetical protein